MTANAAPIPARSLVSLNLRRNTAIRQRQTTADNGHGGGEAPSTGYRSARGKFHREN